MLTSKQKTIVGLDIDAASVAAVELSVNGTAQVRACGVEPLPPGVVREGEVGDPDAVAEALKRLFAEHKLSKNVRLGIANQRVVVRTMLLPAITDAKELETAIRFQAADQIPMPLDRAVLDWQVVGHRDGPDGKHQIEAVVVAARRDMVMSLVHAMRSAGLRPVGIDLSAFAMIRALAGPATPQPAVNGHGEEPVAPATPAPRLYCNLGDAVNLAVAQGLVCKFTRMSPFGIEGIAQALAERRQLDLEHARQWLVHVGLGRPLEEIEGDPEIIAATAEVLNQGAARLVDELRRSLEFYGAQEGAEPIESIIVCGAGAAIPGLVDRIQLDLNCPVMVGTPPPLRDLDPVVGGRLLLCYGLALEG